MNIHASKGDRVVFTHPSAGYSGDVKTAAEYLVLGETYTVKRCVIRSSSTTVYLEEFPGIGFNSTHFEDADIESTTQVNSIDIITKLKNDIGKIIDGAVGNIDDVADVVDWDSVKEQINLTIDKRIK